MLYFYAKIHFLLTYWRNIMPGGRGNSEDFTEEAAKQAAEIVKKYFEDHSDECKAAAVAGVFAIYAAKVAPDYFLDTDY
jgi:hypothetical protein